MTKPVLLGICGALRADSTNRKLLHEAARLFGDTGALSAYLVLRRVGFALVLAVTGVAIAGAVYLLVPDEPELDHIGYQLAVVDRLEVLDGDARFGVVANVTLPDGTVHEITPDGG